MKPTPSFVTVEAAAEILGLSRTTAYQLANAGELPGCRRLGARRFVVRLDVMLDHFQAMPGVDTQEDSR